ncbi:MAG: hypothetical protein ACM3UU_00825 [Ignavibacteriales bacterium]
MKYESQGFKGIIEQQGNKFTIDTFVGGHLIVSGESGIVKITRFSRGILTIRGKIQVIITFMNAGTIDLGSGACLSVKHFDDGRVVALENNYIGIGNFSKGEIDAGADNTLSINNKRKDASIFLGERSTCNIHSGQNNAVRNKKLQTFFNNMIKDIIEEDAS